MDNIFTMNSTIYIYITIFIIFRTDAVDCHIIQCLTYKVVLIQLYKYECHSLVLLMLIEFVFINKKAYQVSYP